VLAVAWAWRGGKLRRLGDNLHTIVLRAAFATWGVAAWRDAPVRAAKPQPGDSMPYGLAIVIGTVMASGLVWLFRM